MKTVEVHELEGHVYVQTIAVRQLWLPHGGNPFGKATYEIDLLGVVAPRHGPEPPPKEEQRAVRITITPAGDEFVVHVNPAIVPDLARRI